MKLAIFGSSPIALEAALRFHHHGAAVSWFNHGEGIYTEGSTTLGFETLGKQHQDDWKNHYYLPLIEFLKTVQVVRPYPIVSVTKRFLGPTENISGHSRFYDLFRVIYQVDPQEFVKSQKESNPETYQKLSDEMMQSLQSNLEMYEDFDLVLDFRRANKAPSLAASGRALGEGKIGQDKIFYGMQALDKASHLTTQTKELALIGSGGFAVEVLITLEGWLKDIHTRLFVVSTEEDPFAMFFKQATPASAKKLRDIIHYMENEFELEVSEFHQKLREWQELDDFIQAKKPKPAEPIPRLNFFSGHNVTAVDQLIDTKRLFLTLEKPDFRNGLKHPENNLIDLKTIGVDNILSAHDFVKDLSIIYLDANELGYFTLTPKEPSFNHGFDSDLASLKGIEDEIFKIFSPANPS